MNATPPGPNPPQPQRRRRDRASRYQRAMERREAQARADQRFYRVVFGLISFCVLIVLAIAALASNGAFRGQDAGGGAPRPASAMTFGTVEAVGLLVVAVIGVFMWRRISRR